MGFLKKMFGMRTWEELRDDAESLFALNQFGPAKLEFERAQANAPTSDEEARASLQSRIDACCDGIAAGRVALGEEHLEAGALELARLEFEGALEVAVSEEARSAAQGAIDGMEQLGAQQVVEEYEGEPTDEERLALLAGSWGEAQSLEYEKYGAEMDRALLAHLDGDFAGALKCLDALIGEAEFPRFAYLERGRASLALAIVSAKEQVAKDGADPSAEGDFEAEAAAPADEVDTEAMRDAAGEDLRKFISELEEDEAPDARLSAYVMLARLADERGDEEAAIQEYSDATEAMPTDARVYLEMGRYFRGKGYHDEALPILESARDLMSSVQPDWRILHELGLAQRDTGRQDDAIASLEGVIGIFTGHRFLDFPPATATALAELYEATERPDRAADLYRGLCKGSDVERHYDYHLAAARLLVGLGVNDDARTFAQRAVALAKDDAEREAAEGVLTSVE